jgi:acylphosphatase
MPIVHLIIKGKVQGVFYRASAKNKAEELNITGWIKNTDEGNVEAVANGTENQLQQFIEWCKIGPSDAIVGDVIVNHIGKENFDKFSIKRN